MVERPRSLRIARRAFRSVGRGMVTVIAVLLVYMGYLEFSGTGAFSDIAVVVGTAAVLGVAISAVSYALDPLILAFLETRGLDPERAENSMLVGLITTAGGIQLLVGATDLLAGPSLLGPVLGFGASVAVGAAVAVGIYKLRPRVARAIGG